MTEWQDYEKITNIPEDIKAIEINRVFESITSASKELEICYSSISNCLHKRIGTAGGYHWEFV